MDTLTVILITIGAAALLAFVWMGAYEAGLQNGISAERDLANHRINSMFGRERDIKVALDDLGRRPRRAKSAKNRRKASRKAVAA